MYKGNWFDRILRGLGLICVGVVLLAIGMSLGGHWSAPFFPWRWIPGMQGYSWNFDFSPPWTRSHNRNETIRPVEIQEGDLPVQLSILDISLKTGTLRIESGAEPSWKATGFSEDSLEVTLDGNRLRINEVSLSRSIDNDKDFIHSEIELVLPAGVQLESLVVGAGAGRLSFDDVNAKYFKITTGAGSIDARNIEADEAVFESGAGTVNLDECRFDSTTIETGAGRIDFSGDPGMTTRVATGAGAVRMRVAGKEEEYRIEFERGLGSVRIGRDSWNGVGNGTAGNREAERKIEISTGLGSVDINFINE